MAELGMNQFKDIKNNAFDQKEITDKATEVVQNVKTKLGGAYDVASEWMENNSITLFAIGGGILVAGLLTYFIARRKNTVMDENLEKAA